MSIWKADAYDAYLYDAYLNELKEWSQEVAKRLPIMASEAGGEGWPGQLEQALTGLVAKIDEVRSLREGEHQGQLIFHLYRQAYQLFEELEGVLRADRPDLYLPEEPIWKGEKEESDSLPIGEHRLPPLPYPYDALEPVISEEIMQLHHRKHHQSYVDGLNRAEEKMAEARRSGQFELIRHWEREAAFHGSGHYLHTIFWHNMSPDGGGEPTGELRQRIERDFGSFKQFKQHFSEAAKGVEGVGWTLLVWVPRTGRLEILMAEKHQHFAQWDVIPLLVLDVWEHAYYLQYMNDRGAYVDKWWNVVNWPHVAQRYLKASQLRWRPY